MNTNQSFKEEQIKMLNTSIYSVLYITQYSPIFQDYKIVTCELLILYKRIAFTSKTTHTV